MLSRLANRLRTGESRLPSRREGSSPASGAQIPPAAEPSVSSTDVQTLHINTTSASTKNSQHDVSNPLGLSVVAESTTSEGDNVQPVDIIAVHGLNGKSVSTWRHPASGNMWLKDTLPSYVPGCRVSTFGYASRVRGNPSVASVPDFSRALLDALRNLREEGGEPHRSIIFVCHSLGGIVCKQALVFAHMDQVRYGDLLDSTIGIVFLGTPHCGSNIADTALVVGRAVNALSATLSIGTMPNVVKQDLLDALAYDSQGLQELDLSVRHILGKISVTTFYETLPLPPLRTPVVTRQSAVLGLPDEDVLPLNLNHQEICRFPRNTSDCASVCQAIRRLQVSAGRSRAQRNRARSRDSSTSSFNDLERSCMTLFSNFDLRDYKARLPTPVHGTCNWIGSHPSFVTWNERAQSAILWLTGHPGCGKTVLSHSVAKRLEDGSQRVLMYFCDKKITSQQDGKAILTGLIFQLVHRNRQMIRHIRREFEVCGGGMVHSFATLWSVFKSMIKDLKENMVYVIIDALDECETSSCRNLLSVIRELTHNDSSKTVKFLLTSRPILYPPVEVEDVVKEGTIAIDDGELGYSDDIEQFIRHRVDEVALRHSCPEQTKRHLLKAMLSKAGNTFLWTHMVLESLEDSLLASAADFDTIISNLPQSLESTYAGFLAKVPKGNLSTAHCLLSLLLASSRNLRLDEINHALTITNRHQSSGEVSRDSQPAIARTIRGILGPLVRLSGQQVSLVHESVRDFLLRSEEDALSFRSYESCPGMPLITSKSAALQMATVCTLYLLLEDFQTPNSSPEPSPIDETRQTGFDEAEKASDDGDMWGEDTMGIDLLQEPEAVEADLLTGVASRHPFYSYAATKWHYHYSNCEANAPPELKSSVMALLELNNTAGRTWRRLARSQAIDAVTSFPEESSSLEFASHLNLIEATKEILQYGCCSQQEKDEALFWSANGGHQRIVPMLLAANANSEYYSSERHTPLLIAAANGHLECVRLLLSHGCCNVNIKGKRGRTALSLAAGNGHHDVVRYLLKQDSIMPDLGDQSGATPFIWASGGGHLTIISALAKDRRVNIDSQDSQGRTALSWASGDGVEEVVNFLLKRVRGIDPNLGDNTGRTAFSWATGNGHSSVIRVLQQNPKVDKYRLDHDQRSPLSWACGHGHEGAVRALLECEPRGLEDKDMDGWTPMAWAIQCDAPGVIEALFDAGAKDLDEGPRTVLSWAMQYGHLAVVRMLLAKGADPETARDRIPFAEAMGRADLVKELSDALHSRGSYTQ